MYSAIAAKKGGPVSIPTLPLGVVSCRSCGVGLERIINRNMRIEHIPGSKVPLAKITDIAGQAEVFLRSPFWKMTVPSSPRNAPSAEELKKLSRQRESDPGHENEERTTFGRRKKI
jgi:hypothetical protein